MNGSFGLEDMQPEQSNQWVSTLVGLLVSYPEEGRLRSQRFVPAVV